MADDEKTAKGEGWSASISGVPVVYGVDTDADEAAAAAGVSRQVRSDSVSFPGSKCFMSQWHCSASMSSRSARREAVSYTHLTLPTIYSV